MSFFVCTYTVQAKAYCHRQFYDRFKEIAAGNPALIVDSTPGNRYLSQLTKEAKAMPQCAVVHLRVPVQQEFFHRSVTAGANACRDKFLSTDAKYMFVIESDVIPPPDVIARFEADIAHLDERRENWAVLGGLYYAGFHKYELRGLQRTHHVLSGCTIYRRELVEKQPFRYSHENMRAFPDAWICVDAGNMGYTVWNDHEIRCDHIKPWSGARTKSR